MQDLNEFVKWVNEGKRRCVKIEVQSNGIPQILVGEWNETFNYECQLVESVSEINLESITQRRERAELKRLKAKYELEQEGVVNA